MTSEPDEEFERLLVHLRETRGFDFTAYKRSSLMRRVQKRMSQVGVSTFTDYVDYLEVHPDEFVELFNTILINVTSFFRDPPAWDFLSSEIVPRIIAAKGKEDPIRVWCAGCASGEEAYSVAIAFAEALGFNDFKLRVKIYATDVDEEALTVARQGTYSPRAVSAISDERRDQFFEPFGDRYAFRKDLRRSIIFGRHDLIQDAPISRIDLLISRNTLMYFNTDAQARVLARYFYALNEGAFLFLGKAETLLAHGQIFSPVELRYRLFAKPVAGRTHVPAPPANGWIGREGAERADEVLDPLQELSFQEDPLAQMVFDSGQVLVMANKAAEELFRISPRDIGRQLQDLEMSYRPIEIRSPFNQVISDHRPVVIPEVGMIATGNGGRRWFDVHLLPLVDKERKLAGVKVVFQDVTRAHELAEALQQSSSDLETAYEEVQSSNEELETTNEELQSTVEELETTNEELQSTNEELETMNEELQSTNEELESVNDELRNRGEELNEANAFFQSVLRSLRVGLVVVDNGLMVMAWNNRAEDLWGVRADEAVGTHFLNLDIGLRVDQLTGPIRESMLGKTPEFDTVMEATNRRGRRIMCRIGINPLLNAGSDPSGAVIRMEEVEAGSGEVGSA